MHSADANDAGFAEHSAADHVAALLDHTEGALSGEVSSAPTPRAALAEAERELDVLLSSAEEDGRRLQLYRLSARAARLRVVDGVLSEEGAVAGDHDLLVARLDVLLGLLQAAVPPDAAPGDATWTEQYDITFELALELTDRWSSGEPGPARSRDADRIVGLLRPVLVAPGTPADSLPEDATHCRAALGLVLADRYMRAEHDTPERLADRFEAIALLDAARTAGDLDPVLEPTVVLDLVRLSYLKVNDATASGTEPVGSHTAELTALLGLLQPLTTAEGEQGGDAVELGQLLCQLLLTPGSAGPVRRTAIDWLRAVWNRPTRPAEDRVGIGLDLSTALAERSEANTPVQSPGDPAPAVDRAESAAVMENVLTLRWGPHTLPSGPDADFGSAPGVPAEDLDEYTAYLSGLVNLGWADLPEGLLTRPVEAQLLDRMRQLVRLLGPDDEDRAEFLLKAGITLVRDAVARGLPSSYDLGNAAIARGTGDSAFAVGRVVPETVAELREAVMLLRTGTGLYPYADELQGAALCTLGMALLLDFACGLPDPRTDVLQEAVRHLRNVLERLPLDSPLRGEDLHHSFLGALMYSVWYTEPFLPGYSGHAPSPVPDIRGFPAVEDGIQLLVSLMDADTLEREPLFVFVSAMADILRAPEALPSVSDARQWAVRLRRAAGRLDAQAWALRSMMLGTAGTFGLHVQNAGQATAEEQAATHASLREAHALAPAGSPLRAMLEAALRAHTGTDTNQPLRLLRQLIGSSGGGGAPDNRPDQRPAPAPEGPVATAGAPSPTTESEGREFGEAAPALDPAGLVLLGDGRPEPFALPLGRAEELLAAVAPATPAVVAARALVHYHRWLRERDETDLSAAVAGARRASAALEGTPSAAGSGLADRCSEFLARILLDRHLLLGDLTDLDAARHAYTTLLDRVPEGVVHPPLHDALLAADRAWPSGVPARVFRHTDAAHAGSVAPDGARDGAPSPPASVAPATAPFRAELQAALGTVLLLRARWSGPNSGTAAIDEAVGMLRAAERALPHDHHRFPAVHTEVARQALRRARAEADAAGEQAAVEDLLRTAEECPVDAPHRPGVALIAAAALCGPEGTARPGQPSAQAGARSLERAAALLGEVAEKGPHNFHGSRSRCLYGLGIVLLNRPHRPADGSSSSSSSSDGDSGPSRALAVLRAARAALNTTPGDPLSVVLARALALAHRAHGPHATAHRRESREIARSVLTAHSRTVLLQSGAGHGLEAARAVAPDMLRLVRWTLADGMPEAAFEALELGRGLVLNAATVSATVPELLRDANRDDLASRWTQAASEGEESGVPSGLRREVLSALSASAAEKLLVSAPRPAQVGRALRRLDTDALVHLVPGEDKGPGHAVVVTADGSVRTLPLPGLAVDDRLDLYTRALHAFQNAARGENRPGPGALAVMRELHRRRLGRLEAEWKDELDLLCSWAGEAVMGPLLTELGRWLPGETPRITIAAVGALGIVPWHAARCPAPGPRGPVSGGAVYACSLAVLSSCVGARQLVDAAERALASVAAAPAHGATAAGGATAPCGGMVAVVADPQGSRTMHREAALIRELHPGSAMIGGPDRATATPGTTGAVVLPAVPESLVPFLPGRARRPTALLHVNCHAEAGTSPATSVLRLDATRTLSVADILAGASRRDPGMPGGTVVLANCTSDLSLADHDEALTLATALLGAGATTVVGSRWAVVDDPRLTLMMLLFHNELRRGSAPRYAARAAQLWMLDPDRALPPELSRFQSLLDEVQASADSRPPDELEVWASFAHHGR